MINTESLDLHLPSIDNRSEELIYQQASDVLSAESGGLITDFSDSSPAGIILRAQSFTYAEFLYRINLLPLVVLLELLKQLGVERILGTPSFVTTQFTLTAPLSQPFEVPAGTELRAPDGLLFTTTQLLVIPSQQVFGTVAAVCSEIGLKTNITAGPLTLIQPLSFVKSVESLGDAQGGSDGETIEQAINRGIALIKSPSLVSGVDFETAAESIMGFGSRCKAIGLLAQNRVDKEIGSVHLFLASAQDTPATFATISQVRSALEAKRYLGTSLYISPMEFLDIPCRAIVRSDGTLTASQLADSLWEGYKSYCSLRNFEPGDSVLIEEVRFLFRSLRGVARVDYLTLLNELAQDIPMPNPYTLPSPQYLVVQISLPTGEKIEIGRGSLDSL